MKKELSPTTIIGIIVGVVVMVIGGVILMARSDPASRGPHAPPHFDPASKAGETRNPYTPASTSGAPPAPTQPAVPVVPGTHPSDSRPVDSGRGGLGAQVH